MRILCAVCEIPMAAEEAYEVFDLSADEEPLYVCSEQCLIELEKEPEAFLAEDPEYEERWIWL